jgi:hypothetical protein
MYPNGRPLEEEEEKKTYEGDILVEEVYYFGRSSL